MNDDQKNEQAVAQAEAANPPAAPGGVPPTSGGATPGSSEFDQIFGKGQDNTPSTLQPGEAAKPPPGVPPSPGGAPPEEPKPQAAPTKNDDVTAKVTRAKQKDEADAGAQDFDEIFGTKQGGTPSPASTDEPAPAGGEVPKTPPAPAPVKSTVLDVLHGVMEAPSAVVGGLADFVDNTAKLGLAVIDWAEGGATHSEQEVRLGDFVTQPTSTTGKMIRGVTDFLASFAAVPEAKAVEGAGAAVKAASAVGRGAVAEFVGIDGHSGNLANLVAEHSDLLKPVADVFATHSGDSELEGRFKNAVANAIAGAPAEAVVPLAKAFLKGVQYVKNSQGVYDFARYLSKFTQEEPLPALKVQPYQELVLGDPNAAMHKTVKEVNGEIGHQINFAAIKTDDDALKVLDKMTRAEESIAGRADRTVTWTEAEEEAKGINPFMSALGRKGGDGVSQGQIIAFKKFSAAVAQKAIDMSRLASEVPTEVNVANFLHVNRLFAFAHSATEDAVAESGRILNANKIAVPGFDLAKQYAKVLEESGGYGTALDAANKLSKLERPAWSYMSEQLGKIGKLTSDAVAQTYVNGLFSFPVIAVKLSSDFYNIAKVTADSVVAAHLSKQLGTEGGVQFGEAMARIHGLVSAQKEALYALAQKARGASSFKELLSAPVNALEEVKGSLPFEVPPPGKLRAENFRISSDTPFGMFLDFADKATTTMGRLITQQDRYAKLMAYRAEVHAQVYRQAFQDMAAGRVTAEAFDSHVAGLLKNVPEDVHMSAVNAANVATFTQQPGEVLSRLGNAIQAIPVLGRVLLPFKTVPSNIMTETFENTPLAPLVASWRADIAAGGARADMAIARTSTGSAMFNVMMDLALKGTVTGKGPERPGERDNWLRQGNRPYSVRIGDTVISLHRLGVLGVQMGIAADIAESVVNAEAHLEDRDFTKAMTAAVFSISNSVLSETYMKGSADFINAITDPQSKGPNYLKHLAGSFVPMSGLMGTAARIEDPYARTADGFSQAIRRKIPALSADLPFDRDLWGQPKSYRSPIGWAYDAVSPFWVSRANPEPIDKEMAALHYFPTDVSHTIHDGMGKTVELDGKQVSRLKELAGNEIKDPARDNMGAKDYLNAVVSGTSPMSPMYEAKKQLDAQDGGERAKTFIEATIRDYRDKARRRLIAEDGDLATQIDLKHAGNPAYVPARIRFSALRGD